VSERRFRQVDVFTATPLLGNAVAVVLDGAGLDDATMQRLAAWTNLSETTFVLPPTTPEASYRLRIFTPRSELAFAGHPTLGSAHAVLEAGIATPRDGVLRQECRAGVLPIGVDGPRLMVRVPEPRIVRECVVPAAALAEMVGAPVVGEPRAIDMGPVWLVGEVADAAALRALVPDLPAVERLSRAHGLTGVTLFALPADPSGAVVVRSFAPAAGMSEDPVCGSGNASVAAYLAATRRLDRPTAQYRASQGREVGRDGVVEVRVADEGRAIEIGGTAVTVIAGTIAL
jgi:PhzF family phenazine biosynthesis protein